MKSRSVGLLTPLALCIALSAAAQDPGSASPTSTQTKEAEVLVEPRATVSPSAALPPTGNPFDISANRFTFTGHYFDRETGLYYAGARYYDPAVGRFIGRDPDRGSISDPITLNPFIYARVNPLRYVDRHGRQSGPPDDLYFTEQWLSSLPPAEAANARMAEARAQTYLAGMTIGGVKALGENIVGGLLAVGHLAVAGTFPESRFAQYSADQTKRNLEGTEAFLRHPIDTTVEATAEGAKQAGELLEKGHPIDAGAALFRTPAAIYLGARGALEVGRVTLPGRATPPVEELTVPVQEALARGESFTVTEGPTGAMARVTRPVGGAAEPLPEAMPASGPMEVGGFRLTKHGEMPSPRAGMESHHGALSRWMEEHYPAYNPNKAPAVLMPKEAHDLTRSVYNRWRAEMKSEMGGTFDWGKVSEPEIRALGERMFQASKTPQEIQQGYWQWFDRMKGALDRQQVAR